MYSRIFGCGLAAVMAFTLACSSTPGTPTSPSTDSGGTDAPALPDGSTLKVSAPTPISPVDGVEVTDLDPDLVISNSTPTYLPGPVRGLAYVFEIRDAEGQVVYTSPAVPAGADGQTSHEIDRDLEANENHTWRAYATFLGRRGPMSAPASFKTFERRIGNGPSCAALGDPLAIVGCRRAQFRGRMDDEELVDFLRGIAFDLNRAGIPDGPWGILVKRTGGNCRGYSCDIICERETRNQNQYDVLGDAEGAQSPGWRQLDDDDIVFRPCEIIR